MTSLLTGLGTINIVVKQKKKQKTLGLFKKSPSGFCLVKLTQK